MRKGERNSRLLRDFGITVDQYDAMFVAQGGVCAICQLAESVSTNHPERGVSARALAVDHCHVTGKVRGLLCMQCNQALGKLRDSAAIAIKAAMYLANA